MCEKDSQVLPLIRGSDSETFIEYFGWSTTHTRGGGMVELATQKLMMCFWPQSGGMIILPFYWNLFLKSKPRSQQLN